MKQISFIVIVCIILITTGGVISPVKGLVENYNFPSPMGIVTISVAIPDSPSDVIAYRIVSGSNDMSYFSGDNLVDVRPNITSETEAPKTAEAVLIPYGGLPQGAVLIYNKTEYIEEFDTITDEVIAKYPVTTNVQYGRYIDDMPVVGRGGYIYIDLGDNGELIYLNKVWRSVSPDGNLFIIPVSAAIKKLQNGEILNPKKYPNNVNITKIRLGYYEKGRNESQEYMEPAWLFKGTTDAGEDIQYYVYARQFANFTATPTEVTKWQPVQFNDTSDASPVKWFWDFGDGTNSTEQNPSHTYVNGGNYTVNLTVWNDLGSDFISREDYVHVYYTGLAPVARFTSNYTWFNPAGVTPLTLQFTDLSQVSGNNTQWFWQFSDGTNSTEQNPVHTFFYHGSYWFGEGTVNLTITDSYGRTSTAEEWFYIYRDLHVDFVGVPASGSSPLVVNFSELPDEIPEDWVGSVIWDFGDGSSNETHDWEHGTYTKNISHTYSSPGNYTVNLTKEMMDYGYHHKSKQYYITVTEYSNQPVAEFTANTTSGKEPLAAAFTDQSMHSPTRWTWTFGDGATSAEQNPEHLYSAAGVYTVSLAVLNNDSSNTTVKTDYIRVYPTVPPVADFTANITAGDSPLPVAFTDLSANLPVNWTWDFGDGTTSPDQNPEHTYAAPGNYTVSLLVMNDEGSDSIAKTEYILIPFELPPIIDDSKVAPISDFSASPTSGKVPLGVIFTDTSVYYPIRWDWDFGDGTTSTEQDPVHEYTATGTYTVNLTTGNAYGENTTVKADYITVTPAVFPIADFTVNTTSGQVPLAVAFTDTSSGTPAGWSWTFGDGELSSEQNPVHVYTTTGQFTVSLQVTNEDGSNTTTKEQYITGSTVVLPAAEFTADTTSGNAPLAVVFTDLSTGSPVSWHWTFGDDATSDEQNPGHTYTNTGTYTVSLEVTNPDGSNTATKPDYITVTSTTQSPVAHFTGKPTCGKAPLTVKFNDTSTGSPTEWSWDFGDGTTATAQNPVHVYTTAGKYSVSLTATNDGGSNTSTRKDYITVSGSVKPPVANFYARPTSGKAPLSVKFTDASTGNPTGWTWDFGDGSDATDRNPVHSYTNPGKYTVSLTVTNAGGSNTKTRTQYISVQASPTPTMTCTTRPTTTCTVKPTATCTTKPTTTCTKKP
jgi:PKD repeat protein